MLSEISQSEKDKCSIPCDLTYMWNLINKIKTEAWIHGTDKQLSEGRDWVKESEGISPRTYMHNP